MKLSRQAGSLGKCISVLRYAIVISSGETTWVKIAIIWAALYGHKFFMVVVEKTKGMAQVVVDEVWKRIHLSPRISADFPEFAVPMHDVMLSPQRMRVQTCNGKPTYMKQDVSRFHYYKLPTVDGYPNTGAIILDSSVLFSRSEYELTEENWNNFIQRLYDEFELQEYCDELTRQYKQIKGL